MSYRVGTSLVGKLKISFATSRRILFLFAAAAQDWDLLSGVNLNFHWCFFVFLQHSHDTGDAQRNGNSGQSFHMSLSKDTPTIPLRAKRHLTSFAYLTLLWLLISSYIYCRGEDRKAHGASVVFCTVKTTS